MSIRKDILGVIVAAMLLPMSLHAGTTGTLSGRVVDRATGTPLAGANVVLLDVNGASTVSGPDGRYLLIDVLPGTYRLRVSFIGYGQVTVDDVTAVADRSTRIDVMLTQVDLESDTLEVVTLAPLIQLDRTSSVREVERDEMLRMPVRGIAQVAGLQAGVTDQDGNLYIRGGRLTEVDFLVDGVSMRDPISGLASSTIHTGAVERVEVLTGGFDAEYGRVMSGIVRVVTREGSDRYTGTVEVTSDDPARSSWTRAPSFGYRNGDAALGGPLGKAENRMSFFVSGEVRDRTDSRPRWGVDANESEQAILDPDTYASLTSGRLPHNGLSGWTGHGKLTWRLGESTKATVGLLRSKNRREVYDHAFRYNLAHTPLERQSDLSIHGTVTWAASTKTLLTFRTDGFMTRFQQGDGTYFDNLLDYARAPQITRLDPEVLFYRGDDLDTALDESAPYDGYHQRESTRLTPVAVNVTSQVTPRHQVKSGFDVQLHSLRFYHHTAPMLTYLGIDHGPGDEGGFLEVNRYGLTFKPDGQSIVPYPAGLDGTKHPVMLSAFVQDKMEYEGLVVNVGIRYDAMMPRTPTILNDRLPLGTNANLGPEDLGDSRVYHRFSPRVGIGFPLSTRTVLHVNYGIFNQLPKLEHLYVGYDFLSHRLPGGARYPFGNPGLAPEEMSAYEAGITQQTGERGRFTATVYHKSVRDLIRIVGNQADPASYLTYRNQDYGTVKGLEMDFRGHDGKWISVFVSYTLQKATGTGSNPDTFGKLAWSFLQGVDEIPKLTTPLDFDQLQKMTVIGDFRLGPKDGFRIGDHYPLGEVGLNVLFRAGSGFPYTPATPFNEVSLSPTIYSPTAPTNSARGPWSFQVDLKANKAFRVGRMTFDVYTWVINLLNRRNVSAIDRQGVGIQTAVYSSGSPLSSNWLSTSEGREFVQRFGESGREKFLAKELDPMNFSTPRQVRFGMRIEF